MMNSSEELAGEHMAAQDHVISRTNSLEQINLDPLPRENMVIEGAEQGGTTDVRAVRRIIGAAIVTFLILLGLLIGVIVGLKIQNRASSTAYSAPKDTNTKGSTTTIIGNMTGSMKGRPVGSQLQDDDSTQGFNSQFDETSAMKIRRDSILSKLYDISGEAQINDNLSAQYAAARWLIDYDLEKLDANSDRLSQRYVIALLYYILNGASWVNSTGFLSASHECLWHGITCLSGQVYQIDLSNNTMQGRIPNETVVLKGMQVLNFRRNNLKGSIPESLYNLTSLVYLDLSENLITGTLSPNLKNLQHLGKFLSNSSLRNVGIIESF